MSKPFGMLRKEQQQQQQNSSQFASCLALQLHLLALPMSIFHPLVLCAPTFLKYLYIHQCAVLFLVVFFALQCLCTHSFCLYCLPTFFWPLIGKVFSILKAHFLNESFLNSWFIIFCSLLCLYIPALWHFPHCIINICSYVCLWLACKFLESWNYGWPFSSCCSLRTIHLIGIQECYLNE